jgi:hypothetical protein
MVRQGLIALVFAYPTVALANCPIGSFEWVDDWGNKICKSFDSGATKSVEGSTQHCPTGTYAWSDNWGNAICKSYNSGQEYHDTSKGCPIGTYQWQDNWGNPTCRKF